MTTEVEKLLQRLIHERDNHFRNAADSRLRAETLDYAIIKLSIAIDNDSILKSETDNG